MVIIRGVSRESLVSRIESLGRIYYEKDKNFDQEKIWTNRVYWDTDTNVLSNCSGQAYELASKICRRGFNDELSRRAEQIGVAINIGYKSYTRIKVRVYNNRILRDILNREPTEGPAELEVWYYKENAWGGEFRKFINFTKERI